VIQIGCGTVVVKKGMMRSASPDNNGFFGEIQVRRGLKRTCRRRTLKINREMRDVLQALMAKSTCLWGRDDGIEARSQQQGGTDGTSAGTERGKMKKAAEAAVNCPFLPLREKVALLVTQ
jgi:hypothetical protein